MSIDETIRTEIRITIQEALPPTVKNIFDCAIQELVKEITDSVVSKIISEFSTKLALDSSGHKFDDMLSEKEAAVVVKKSPKTLRNYRYSLKVCEIPYHKEGGKILYKFSDLIAYRDKCKRSFTPYQK